MAACTHNNQPSSPGQYLVDNFNNTPEVYNSDDIVIRSNTDNSASYYALLSNSEKKLYQVLYKSITEGKTTVSLSGEIDNKVTSRVVRSIVNDHPELIWLAEGYSQRVTTIDDRVSETKIQFICNALVDSPAKYIKQMDSVAETILAQANTYNTPEAKEKFIHDYLVMNVKYDRHAYEQSAYGALVSQQAVCSGIARAFKYLLDQVGIPNYVVTGQLTDSEGITGSHAWNIVVLNGHCYNVDVTSDEVIVIKGNSRTRKADDRLFNKSDSEFRNRG
ncbi:MAG: hypothetical protein J6A01_12605, partial [Proteobacteria bacterium]|nr:hypothetical protein [Pseudomonadota bacterium]